MADSATVPTGNSLRVSPLPLDPARFLPPIRPWQGASEALIAAPDNPWITPSEQTGLTDSPSYEETLAWLRRLAAASPRIRLVEFGRTAQGRPLMLAIASQEGADTPAALRASGRPTLLAQAGIHSGEIDGKDAGLMLLRDLAFTDKARLLERANFILIPVFNADGHERSSAFNRPNQRGPVHQGWRTTAQNLNLNRDYSKADAPEMRALLSVLNDWDPALYLDLHVTDGIDCQYDITWGHNGYQGGFAWSPRIGQWMDQVLDPAVEQALASQGHVPGPLVFANNDRDLLEGISLGVSSPRFSHGYGDLRHLGAILVENHSLKGYRERVLGTYVLLEAVLRTMGAQAETLKTAITADRSARASALAINWTGKTVQRGTIDFKGIAYEDFVSPATGIKEVRWLGVPKLYEKLPVFTRLSRLSIERPKAYYVPITKPELIERLRVHGIHFEVLNEAQQPTLRFARLVSPQPAAQPFEGHQPLKVGQVNWENRHEEFPAGSIRVPTDQPLGDLAMALLDPRSDDSFLAAGFFQEILQRTEYIEGYVLAPLAERMLNDSPKLKEEFEAKLAADPAFAKDPTARLQWFYERSPFYDQHYLLYPVGIEQE